MLKFYSSFIPNAVVSQQVLQNLIHGIVKNDNTQIKWTYDTLQANATLLSHYVNNASLTLTTDASSESVRMPTVRILFYASTYDRELLAIYQGVEHFQHILEGRIFTIFTDHKPLVFAFRQKTRKKTSPRRTRQLDYISQFSTDIRHIDGKGNITADFLSRINSIE